MRLQRKNGVDMISLMLSLAQFEFVLKNIFERLFSHKIEQWNEYKRQGVERMTELCMLSIVSDICDSIIICSRVLFG